MLLFPCLFTLPSYLAYVLICKMCSCFAAYLWYVLSLVRFYFLVCLLWLLALHRYQAVFGSSLERDGVGDQITIKLHKEKEEVLNEKNSEPEDSVHVRPYLSSPFVSYFCSCDLELGRLDLVNSGC